MLSREAFQSKLAALAVLLEREDDTTRRLQDLAAAPKQSGSGPRQRGTHTDPTGAAVVSSESNRWGDRLRRWQQALHDLDREAAVLTGRAGATASISARRIAHAQQHLDNTGVIRVTRIVDELEAAIYDAAPTTAARAKEQLDAEHRLELASRDCRACESPIPKGEMRSGWCRPCNGRRGRHPEMDDTEFKNWIAQGITTGTLSGYAASPYREIGKQARSAMLAM